MSPAPKLKFPAEKLVVEFSELKRKSYEIFQNSEPSKQNTRVFLSGLFLFLIYISCIVLFWASIPTPIYYLLLSMLMGVLCVPMILVIGHESVHGNFTTNKMVNAIGKNVFYFLGTSSYFWQLRHINAHHNYTNIREWDKDIEQSKLIRLDDSQPHRPYHKYQPYYMPFLFMLYTLNWFFFRDFKDIKERVFGNKKVHKHPVENIFWLFVAKVWHFGFLVIVPLWLNQSLGLVIAGFFVFHFSASITTTMVLVSTHIGEDHELIHAEGEQELPYSWYVHQIRTSGDFCTDSFFVLHFFGGFNHHLTHHLFPNIPYTVYPQITPLVKDFCTRNNLPYNNYASLSACIKSHFIRLKHFSKN